MTLTSGCEIEPPIGEYEVRVSFRIPMAVSYDCKFCAKYKLEIEQTDLDTYLIQIYVEYTTMWQTGFGYRRVSNGIEIRMQNGTFILKR